MAETKNTAVEANVENEVAVVEVEKKNTVGDFFKKVGESKPVQVAKKVFVPVLAAGAGLLLGIGIGKNMNNSDEDDDDYEFEVESGDVETEE